MLNILGAKHHGRQLALEFSSYQVARRLLRAFVAALVLFTFGVWFGCQVYAQECAPVSPAHYHAAN